MSDAGKLTARGWVSTNEFATAGAIRQQARMQAWEAVDRAIARANACRQVLIQTREGSAAYEKALKTEGQAWFSVDQEIEKAVAGGEANDWEPLEVGGR